MVQSPPPPPPTMPPSIPHGVSVAPTLGTSFGDLPVQYQASASGDTSTAFAWTVSDTVIGTVTEHGLVHPSPCRRAGKMVVMATAVSDSTLRGTAEFAVLETSDSKASVVGLYRSGTDSSVDLHHVSGLVDIAVSAFKDRPCPDPHIVVDSMVVYVSGATAKHRIGVVPRFTVVPPPVPLRLTWNTAEGAPAAPRFPNGEYAITADAFLGPPHLPNAMGSNAVPITIRNP